MKNIRFTKHASQKFLDLAELGINISEFQVIEVLLNPENIGPDSDKENMIATGKFGLGKLLRVVYRNDGDKIVVITFYPAKIGRYL
jgi:hypothetical protein